jgi:serine/threonine protein kinase, bacterial
VGIRYRRSRELDEVIATGMAKEPDRRYGTTVELANPAREAIAG